MKHTTTHDPRGGGHARLILALGGGAQADTVQREFELLPGVTVIGSGAAADLRLTGLGEHHAEVRRDEFDEYIYVDLGTSAGSRVDGKPADHGRPYGGRQGGEFSVQRTQDEPRARGTSASGGSDRKGTDPGEYF